MGEKDNLEFPQAVPIAVTTTDRGQGRNPVHKASVSVTNSHRSKLLENFNKLVPGH
jgi:hypothetical protein